MKKLKLFVSSLIAMLAFAIFAVTGIKVNAIEYSETHDYAWEASDFYDTAATGVKGGSFDACAYGIISFGDSGYNVGTYSGVTNNTGETLGDFALVPTGGSRTMTFALPSGQTKVSITMFVANINKTASNGSYPAATSNNRNITFSGSYSNLKYDGTSVSSVTVGYDAKVHTITFDYTGSTTITSAQNAAFLGAYGDNVAVSGFTVKFYDSDKSTVLGVDAVSSGDTTTNIPTAKPSTIGYTFDKWLKVSDNEEFDLSTAITGNIELYASYKADPNYAIGEGNDLNSSILGAVYEEGFTSFTANTALPSTLFTLLSNTAIQKTTVDEVSTYKLNTGGEGNNTKRGIAITTATAGTITFIADGNGSERTASISKIVGTSNTVLQSYTLNKNDSSTEYTFTVEAAGTYYLYGAGTINIYYASFEEAAAAVTPTVTAGTVTGVDSENKTAVAFVAKIENVTDVALLTDMSFHLVATHGDAEREADYAEITTCYTALTSFGEDSVSDCAAADNTYYVYFVVSGITSDYDGLTLAVTFNASYDGVKLTQTTFNTYTYTSSQA